MSNNARYKQVRNPCPKCIGTGELMLVDDNNVIANMIPMEFLKKNKVYWAQCSKCVGKGMIYRMVYCGE